MQYTLLFVQSTAQSVDINKELAETSFKSLQQLGHVIISNTVQSRNADVTLLGQATFEIWFHDLLQNFFKEGSGGL